MSCVLFWGSVLFITGAWGQDTASPFLHPTPLLKQKLMFFFHFHGLEICKTAIICRFLSTDAIRKRHIIIIFLNGVGCKKGGCCVLSPSTCAAYLFNFLCLVVFFCLFVFILCFVPVSLCCPLLIALFDFL